MIEQRPLAKEADTCTVTKNIDKWFRSISRVTGLEGIPMDRRDWGFKHPFTARCLQPVLVELTPQQAQS